MDDKWVIVMSYNIKDYGVLLIFSLFLVVILMPVYGVHASSLVWVRDYKYTPLLDNNPQGRLNLIVSIYKQLGDGVSTRDWYFYKIKIQTVPGTVSYGSDWETSETFAWHKTYEWLVDYDPTTTNGYYSSSASVSVTLTSEGANPTFTYSWGYTIPFVSVIDQSDFSQNKAVWKHDFNEKEDPVGSPSDSTYLAKPGFVVKTYQDGWSFVDAYYKVTWGHPDPVWWWLGIWQYNTYQSPTILLDARLVGD